jgi:hypothetical protein
VWFIEEKRARALWTFLMWLNQSVDIACQHGIATYLQHLQKSPIERRREKTTVAGTPAAAGSPTPSSSGRCLPRAPGSAWESPPRGSRRWARARGRSREGRGGEKRSTAGVRVGAAGPGEKEPWRGGVGRRQPNLCCRGPPPPQGLAAGTSAAGEEARGR